VPQKVKGAKAVVVVLVQVFGITGNRGSSIDTVCFGSRNSEWTRRTRQHPFCVLDRIWQVFLNRRAAARYRSLASILPGHEGILLELIT